MVVKVRCKNCGNLAPADQFKLDHRYGHVVCPVCRKGKSGNLRNEKIQPRIEKKELPKSGPRKARPAGWDEDDVLLEKLWAEKQKKKKAGSVVKVGNGLMKYTCNKCSYSFTFSENKRPKRCPYCSRPIR